MSLCIPDDQLAHVPKGIAIPVWPRGAHLPRKGDVIYLTSTSAWVVRIVIHEFVPCGAVRIELWVDWVGAARHRPADCSEWVQ